VKSQVPRNTWRHTAHIYTNWIKALYEATPCNIEDIPRTFWPAELPAFLETLVVTSDQPSAFAAC
jgi:hypothetical protein